jgi:hypothetical protein
MNDLGIYGLIAMIIAGLTLYLLHRRHQGRVLDEYAEAGATEIAVAGARSQPTVGARVVAEPAVGSAGQATAITRRPDRELPPGVSE